MFLQILQTKNLVCEYYDICENKIFVYCNFYVHLRERKKTKGQCEYYMEKSGCIGCIIFLYIYIPKTHQSPESSESNFAPAHLKVRSDEEIETAPRVSVH